jgi:transcriptional regulator with XRE-family HTH domain
MFSIDKQPSEIALLLAQKVRVLRKDKGYSQKELAERCGVSLGSIKRFEQSGQISLESLLKIAHLLGKLNDFESILNPPEISKDILNKLFKS